MWVDRISGYRAFLQDDSQLDFLKESTTLRVVHCQSHNHQASVPRLLMFPSPIRSPHMDNIPRAESNIILDSILTYYTKMTDTQIQDDGSYTPAMPSQKQNHNNDNKHASNLMTDPIAIKDIGEFPLPPLMSNLRSDELFTVGSLTTPKHSPEMTRTSSEAVSKTLVGSRSVVYHPQTTSPNISQPNKFRPLQLIGSPRTNVAINNYQTSQLVSKEGGEPRSETIDNTDFWYDEQQDKVNDPVQPLQFTRDTRLRGPDWRARASRSKPADQLVEKELLPAINFGADESTSLQARSIDKGLSWLTSDFMTWRIPSLAEHRGSLQSQDSFWNLELLPASQQRLLDCHSTQSLSQNEETGQSLDQPDEAQRNVHQRDSVHHSPKISDEQEPEQQLDDAHGLRSSSFSSYLSAIRDLESSLRTSSNSASSSHNRPLSCTASDASGSQDVRGEASCSSRGSSLDAFILPGTFPTASKRTHVDISRSENPQQFRRPFPFPEPKEQLEMEIPDTIQQRVEPETKDKVQEESVDWKVLADDVSPLNLKNDIPSGSSTRKRSATQYDTKLTWPFPASRVDQVNTRQRSNTQPNKTAPWNLSERLDNPPDWKEKSLPALPYHLVSQRRQALEDLVISTQPLQHECHISNMKRSAISIPQPVCTRKSVLNLELHKSLPALPEVLDTSAIAASPLSKEVPLPEFMTIAENHSKQPSKEAVSLDTVLATDQPQPLATAYFRNSRFVPHSMEESAATSEEEKSSPSMEDIKSPEGEIHDAYVIRSYDREQDNLEPEPPRGTPSCSTAHEQPSHDKQTEIESQQHEQKQNQKHRGCSSGFLHLWQNFGCSASRTRAARTRSPAEIV